MKQYFKTENISLIVSVILIMITVAVVIASDYTIGFKHYVGFILVAISLLLYPKQKKYFVITHILTLTLGLINVIDIFYTTLSFGVGDFRLNPIFLILLVIFIGSNKALLNKLFP